MRILSVHIREFGGLSDLSLDFSEGLNLIYGGNESGKSTVLAFIRFAFYGLTRREQGEPLSDSERYCSWDNGVADGSLRLEKDGTVYRIERREQSGTTRKLLQIVNETTGETLPKGETPEMLFLGFPRAVFDSTACIRQLRSVEINGDELSQAIENLLLSGDESVDTDKVLKALDKARTALLYKNRNGGEIYRLDGEISALSARLEQLRADTAEMRETALAKETLKSQISAAAETLHRAEKNASLLADAQILARFDELHELEKRVEREAAVCRSTRDALTRDGFLPDGAYVKALEEHAERLEAAERACIRSEAELRIASEADVGAEELLRAAKEIRLLGGTAAVAAKLDACTRDRAAAVRLMGIFFPVGGAFLLLGVLLALLLQNPVLLAISLGACLSAVGLVGHKRRLTAERRRGDLLASLGLPREASTGEAVALCTRAFREEERETERTVRLKAANEAHDAMKATETERRTAAARDAYRFLPRDVPISKEKLRETAQMIAEELEKQHRADLIMRTCVDAKSRLEASLSAYDEATLRAGVPDGYDGSAENAARYTEARDRAREELTRLENERLAVERRLSALEATVGSPEALESELAEKTAQRAALEAKFRAIVLAHKSIGEARDGLKARISPRLRADASRYLSVLSCGRYDALSLGGGFELSSEQNGISHPSDAYSGGTRDAMYLSLRLALTDLLQNGKDSFPLLLDEALAQLDNDRATALLTLLLTRAENGGQTIFFTCHTRESELLKDKPFHLLRL